METQDLVSRIGEVKNELAQKCGTDEDFRTALIADTQGTIESEYGLEPGALEGLKISVVVEADNELIVPIGPDMSEMELSDEQLDHVAGGAAFVGGVACAVIGVIALGGPAAAYGASRARNGGNW